MRAPRLTGVVERRLLVNYRADPAVVTPLLPTGLAPQTVDGAAVVGICLIRLGQLRPVGLPAWVGRRSENAAHRVAVQWEESGRTCTGVYIPRRDSDSRLNVLLGGRVFPGEHHSARFDVEESDTVLRVGFSSRDGSASVEVEARVSDRLASRSLFASLEEASAFFEQGAVGWSATRSAALDGLELRTRAWAVEPVQVLAVRSSYFSDPATFPPGSVELDGALLMRQVPVEWRPVAARQSQRRSPVGAPTA